MQDIIKNSGYNLKDIFNMDETGLFYAYVCYLSSEVQFSNKKETGYLQIEVLQMQSLLVLKGGKFI